MSNSGCNVPPPMRSDGDGPKVSSERPEKQGIDLGAGLDLQAPIQGSQVLRPMDWRLGGLNLPRNSMLRFTDRPDMT